MEQKKISCNNSDSRNILQRKNKIRRLLIIISILSVKHQFGKGKVVVSYTNYGALCEIQGFFTFKVFVTIFLPILLSSCV